MRIPFGAKIEYVPAPGSSQWTERKPFSARGIVGVFLGWEMDAGCRFRGKYRVAPLCDFDDTSLRESRALKSRRVYSSISSRITWPLEENLTITKWEFPLLTRY